LCSTIATKALEMNLQERSIRILGMARAEARRRAVNAERMAEARLELERLLRSRRSVRAFRADPVSRSQVLEILDLASTAPSNSNTQPWRVHVLAGSAKRALSEELASAHEADNFPPPAHFPEMLPEKLRSNQEAFGRLYYGALGIDRDDRAARARQSGKNYDFFGAPVGLIFTVDGRLTQHSWLDCGLFVQNVMIAARIHGLDTCPQVSFVRYQALIARHLGFVEDEVVACGMSMGYADPDAPVNAMSVPREPVNAFARLAGFSRGARGP
jgi:nitroreductase